MKKPKVKEGLRAQKATPAKPKKESKATKAKKVKKAAEAVGSVLGHNNLGDPKLKAEFLKLRGPIDQAAKRVQDIKNEFQKKLKSANTAHKALLGTARAQGFTSDMFDYARKFDTPEGEEGVRAQVVERLQVAAWMGADIGEQLSLFMEPSRVPIVDRARKEGETASMEGKALDPHAAGYVPNTDAWNSFTDGWHGHQATVAGGIKELKPGADTAH